MKTYSIALINPHKSNKFYINPYYLQLIEAKIKKRMASAASTHLLDVNIDQEDNASYADLIIIDTPEGCFSEVLSIIEEYSNKIILLVGDTVKYGQFDKIFENYKNYFNNSIYGCIYDDKVAEYVESLCLGKDIKIEDTDSLIL